MFLVFLNFLFNGYQLVWIYAFCLTIIGYWTKMPKLHDWQFLVVAYGTIALFILIGLSSLMHWCLKLILDVRKPVGRERERIDTLLSEVINNSNQLKETRYSLDKLCVMITDKKESNGGSLGRNTIILTSGMLKTANDEELKAALAHELGHLYHKDSLMLIMLVFSSLPTAFFMWLYSWYNRFSSAARELLPLGTFWQIILFLVFLPIIVAEVVGRWFFRICVLYLSRRFEYRADRFAVDLGYKDGLISSLEKVDAIKDADNTLLGIVLSTHPAPMKRIGKLEDM